MTAEEKRRTQHSGTTARICVSISVLCAVLGALVAALPLFYATPPYHSTVLFVLGATSVVFFTAYIQTGPATDMEAENGA